MGRTPWSTRLCVEDCYSLAIASLVRRRLFSTPIGTISSVTWTNSEGDELFRLGLRLSTTAAGRLALQFYYDAADSYALRGSQIAYRVEIAATPCRFGGRRYWFLCPVFLPGIHCRRRVRMLYLPPGSTIFGCRQCHDLTYKSCQTHNKRLDRLINNPQLLREALRSPDPGEAILGVRAWTRLVGRLRRKT